jgi:hypothetical protein
LIRNTEVIHDNLWSVKIGEARVSKLANQYRTLGYFVIENSKNHEGVDLIIISTPNGKITKVIEVTNYKKPEYFLDNTRFNRYVDTLISFSVIDGIELELVVSFKENLSYNQVMALRRNNINVHVEGPQDLPNNGMEIEQNVCRKTEYKNHKPQKSEKKKGGDSD